MRINRSTSLLLSAALAVAVAAPAAANRPQDAKDQSRDRIDATCENGNELYVLADQTMWPPNHKTQPVEFVAVDADGGDVVLTTTATHDEYVTQFVPSEDNQEEPEEEVGSGNTQMDAQPFFATDTESGTNSNIHEIRSERSGRGDGRDYTLTSDATFSDGSSCELDITVHVPHDMRSDKAPAKEDKTDSTGPNNGNG